MPKSFENTLALMNLFQKELVGETGPSGQPLREFCYTGYQPCVCYTELIPANLSSITFDDEEQHSLSFDTFKERYVDRLRQLHYYLDQLLQQIKNRENRK